MLQKQISDMKTKKNKQPYFFGPPCMITVPEVVASIFILAHILCDIFVWQIMMQDYGQTWKLAYKIAIKLPGIWIE